MREQVCEVFDATSRRPARHVTSRPPRGRGRQKTHPADLVLGHAAGDIALILEHEQGGAREALGVT